MAKHCNGCSTLPITIPFAAHESDMCRMERANKRLWIALISYIAVTVALFCGFLIYEGQYETAEIVEQEVEQTVDGDGANRFVGGNWYGGLSEG